MRVARWQCGSLLLVLCTAALPSGTRAALTLNDLIAGMSGRGSREGAPRVAASRTQPSGLPLGLPDPAERWIQAGRTVSYKPSKELQGQRCGGQPATELPWDKASKTAKFYSGNLTVSERNPSKSDMRACLGDVNLCGKGAHTYAQKSTALQMIRKQTPLKILSLEKLNTCAIVGNSGALLGADNGKYIDNHELVVRFNTLPTKGYHEKVGARTTFRFLNHARSMSMCHSPSHSFPEYDVSVKEHLEVKGFILWNTFEREQIQACLSEKFAGRLRVVALSPRLESEAQIIMAQMVLEANELGVEGLMHSSRTGLSKMPKELTSGAHAILMLTRMCKSVSLYGMSSYHKVQQETGVDQHYQYSGRANLRRSGVKYHDWALEAFAWKFLNAAGAIDLCSF